MWQFVSVYAICTSIVHQNVLLSGCSATGGREAEAMTSSNASFFLLQCHSACLPKQESASGRSSIREIEHKRERENGKTRVPRCIKGQVMSSE